MNTAAPHMPVPRLTTAQTGPLLKLESTLLARATDIVPRFERQCGGAY